MNVSGASNRTTVAVIVVLVAALITVFVLWQRDRESQDVRLDVDIGAVLPDR